MVPVNIATAMTANANVPNHHSAIRFMLTK